MIDNHGPSREANMEQALLERIRERTGGRIRSLIVVVADDRIGVRGKAASFHLKQLAIRGILDVIGSPQAMRIELEIEVDAERPPSRSIGFADPTGAS
jgi:hypothetical protein